MRKNFTPTEICENCGKLYFAEPCRRGKARFCSVACRKAHAVDGVADRFWAGVDRSGGERSCWPWTGATDKGYGVITIRTPSGRRKTTTHRLALKLSGIDVPDGAFVCHRCDNPPCCNPAHLYIGTPLDNVQDMMERGQRTPKLTADIVREARRRILTGNASYQQLATEYGCHLVTIREAVIGKTWKHVIDVPPVTESRYKLSAEGARIIRQRRAEDGARVVDLANEFGVSKSAVRALLHGETWAEGDGAPGVSG